MFYTLFVVAFCFSTIFIKCWFINRLFSSYKFEAIFFNFTSCVRLIFVTFLKFTIFNFSRSFFSIFIFYDIDMVFDEWTSLFRFYNTKVDVHVVCAIDYTCCCCYFCSFSLACVRVNFICHSIFISCCWGIAWRNFKFYCVFTISKAFKFIITISICCSFLIGHVDSLKDNFYASNTYFIISLWAISIGINPNFISKSVCFIS